MKPPNICVDVRVPFNTFPLRQVRSASLDFTWIVKEENQLIMYSGNARPGWLKMLPAVAYACFGHSFPFVSSFFVDPWGVSTLSKVPPRGNG